MAETEIPQKIDDRPEHIYLNRHVRNKLCEACDVNPQAWKDLGIELMPDAVAELSTVSAQHHGSVVDCCSSLFQLWLQKQPNASWRQLIEALKKISLNRLATEIEGKFIQSVDSASQSVVPLSPIEAIVYGQSTTSSVSVDVSINISDTFKEPITIANAYIVLCTQLENILQHCDLFTLKKSLFRQADTPDGVELEVNLMENIKEAKSVPQLLNVLEKSNAYTWLDTRLIEALAYGSLSSSAVEVVKAYQRFLFPKKLLDVLPKKSKPVIKQKYAAAVRAKTEMDPSAITVKDFIDYWYTVHNVLLDLAKGMLNIELIDKGCLEISYLIPVHYSFNAYKMVLHNRYKFYTFDLIHIEIGDYPLIYDPWLSDMKTHSVKQILHTQQEMYRILWENLPVDNIIKLFTDHKLFTDDDVDVISLAPSEYLKSQFLFRYLQHLKLSVWSMVCDVLHNTKSLRHIGSQLMNVFKDKLSQMEHYKQTLASDKHIKSINTLHGTKTIKLNFVDDSTLFNKSQTHYPRKVSLLICPFQHVKYIKPSEVDREFQYVSGHVLELLSHCHPKLLINWCENLLASELANDSPSHKLFMLWFDHFDNPMDNEQEIKLLPPCIVYKLRKLRTSSAILKMMSMFWSWSNHSILTSLVEFSEIAAALLEEFDSRLYLNSSITKYPISSSLAPAMIPYNNNSFTVLTLKCNRKSQVTLQLVYDIQSMMMEKCEVTQHALQLLAVQSSPLVLQWMISKYIVTVINVNVRKHQEYFATKGITEILIHPNIKHCIDGNFKLLPIREKADELFSAAKTGNAAETEKLVQSGVYIDSTDNTRGWTPLCRASGSGHHKVVEILITAGADVNLANNRGWTPLYMASESGHYKVVEVLITAGADVNLANERGETPLNVASENGYNKVVVVLITAGADVNLADNREETPLYVASWHGHYKVVKVLITAGADVNPANKWGGTPLYVASLRGHYKVVEVLITAGADVNLADNFGRTPVDAAINGHHHKVVDVLLKSAANINIDSKVKLEHFSKSRSAHLSSYSASSRYSSEYLSASSSKHASSGYSSASSSRYAYSSDSGYSSSSMSSKSTWSSSTSGLTWSNVRSVGITDEPHIKEEEFDIGIDVEDPSLQGKELTIKSTVATNSDEDL